MMVQYLYPHPTLQQCQFWDEVAEGKHVDRPHVDWREVERRDFRRLQEQVRELAGPAVPAPDEELMDRMSVHSSGSTEY